mgnify:CR=1 FL=1
MDIKNAIEENISIKTEMLEKCVEVIEIAACLMIDAIKEGKKIEEAGIMHYKMTLKK